MHVTQDTPVPPTRRPPVADDPAEERRIRKERLAAGLRVLGARGLTTGIAGHVTVRDPELTDHFWVNPYRVPFTRMRVSDLLLVDREGRVVEGTERVNAAAFAIHAAVHEAFPDLNAAAHSHAPNGRPWSATGRFVEMTSQDACAFFETQVLFERFSGVVLDPDEGRRIAAALARPTPWPEGNKVAILENHGILTVGETVDEAVFWFVLFEDLCGDQLRLEATNRPYRVLDDTVAAHTRAQTGTHYAGWANFQSLYADIVAEQPDLLD
jgi:ribulose-5-phosphate 4-epimerase/fuculose-1-phosphate aldolase